MAQFKRVWLPYTQENSSESSGVQAVISSYPTDDEETEKANTEIQNLITLGWRIVSTAPVTGSLNLLHHEMDDVYHTFTTGIEVFMVYP